MTTRLPVDGADTGQWGSIIDAYLNVGHNASGSTKGAATVVNVMDDAYGAKGDGVTDDTAAIQAAINAVPANGGMVWFPAGTYIVSSTLTISVQGTIIAGSGWGAQLRYDGNVCTPLFKASSVLRVFFRDIRLSQTNSSSFGTAIDASNFNGGITERVLIDGGGASGVPPNIGIDFNGASGFYHAVSDCRINVAGANGVGIRFTGGANSHVVRNCRVIPSVVDATNIGVKVDATAIELDHVDIENAAGTAISITAIGHGCILKHCYLEANGTNVAIASGAVAPAIIGGTNESAATANLSDAGAVGLTILGVRNGSVPYNHGAHNTLRVPDNVWTPADHGLVAWSFDPALISNGTVITNGTAYFVAIPIRYAVSVSTLWFIITTAGVTPTAGQNFLGLYSIGATQATLLAAGSADAVLTTTGPRSVAIAAQALTPGYYLVCLMVNCATPPAIARNTGAPGYGNLNLSTAQLRFFSNTTVNTTALPGTITLASNTTANPGTQDFFVGVS